MSTLRNQPTGTRVTIGDRSFVKTEVGTMWREDLGAMQIG